MSKDDVDVIFTMIGGGMVGYAIMMVRELWITRRQPVRKDAPTGDDSWVRPNPFWRD